MLIIRTECSHLAKILNKLEQVYPNKISSTQAQKSKAETKKTTNNKGISALALM